MREIKFRAWNKETKIMDEVIMLGEQFCSLRNTGSWDRDGLELMQYTGLKDKNGVEIYEGDIVKTTSELMTGFGKHPTGKFLTTHLSIEYDETNAQFKERDIISNYLKPLGLTQHIISQYTEVIGDIYKNKELLNADKR